MSTNQNDCGCGSSSAVPSVAIQPQQVEEPILACNQNVTALVCTSANVSITPTVTAGTPIVSCVPNTLIINPVGNPCPGFIPTNTGVCAFNVSQVICVSIPLTFFAEVSATQNGSACGPVEAGTECPALPTTPTIVG